MTTNGLGLRAPDPAITETVEDVTLPRSIWGALQKAARDAGLSLGEAVAQILVDRCTAQEAPPRAPASRRRASPRKGVDA